MIKISFFSLVLLASTLCSAEEKKDPRPEMHVMAQEISTLQKFLLNESQFLSPNNDTAIKSSLDKLTAHVSKLEGGTFAENPVLKANIGMLSQHIHDADKYFKEGNKPFSRFMLQSSLQMCIACHTRGKTDVDFALPESSLENVNIVDLGDYLFATRQFEKGRQTYEKVVADYPGNKVGPYALRKALLALAVYFARVKENPKAGHDYFDSLNKRKDFPEYVQLETKAWSADFSHWQKNGPVLSKSPTEMELLTTAKKILKSDDFSLVGDSDRKFHIRRLHAAALLHRILESPGDKSPSKGEALLYLGRIYQKVAHQMFFRFGEMYLKACIQDYKKTQVAKDCYTALEEAVTEGYTGSAGTNIPQEEEVELFRLKKLAF